VPLAKSAPITTEIKQTTLTKEPTSIISQKREIPIEVYKFFEINPLTDEGNDELGDVVDWAYKKGGSIGGMMREIRNLEIKLGQPSIGETRLNKLTNWIRISNNIKSMSNSMEREINNIRLKYKTQLAGIHASQKERIKKINDEIERIKKDYRNVNSAFKARSQEAINKIHKEYDGQLKELYTIQQVYGRKK